MTSTPPRGTPGHKDAYASMGLSRSSFPFPKEPESPSTMLLRELQGNDSPTRPSSTSAQSALQEEEEEEDDDGPSPSLLYGTHHSGGDKTPRSPPTPLPTHRPISFPREPTPNPFDQPPSSSASGRSGSTSPGPSTISIYASGLDAESSASTSTSPLKASRPTPTFRESPITRPAAPVRNVSGGSGKKASPRSSGGERRGYLDPPLSESRSKGKGKEKARNQGGRKYVSVAASAEEDEVDQLEEERPVGKVGLNAYERALWKWVNVEDLDGYLQEVYAYYKGKGFFCIILARFLNLITTFFVIGFSTFLFSCIDYSKLDSELSGPNAIGRLDDVLIKQCLSRGSFPHMIFLISVGIVYLFQLASFVMSIPRLVDMYRFYTHLLGIPDADIQTLPWPEIVRLVGEIRKHNPITSLSGGQADALAELVGNGEERSTTKKLDAHDVANRILRQENYLIALFNKDLLDLRVRFPLPHSVVPYVPFRFLAPSNNKSLPNSRGDKAERRFLSFGKNTLTKALEWNLRFCLMGYLFDGRGQVRKEFVREKKRKDLVEGLKRRFIFMAVLNAILSPFIVFYLLIYSFFRYFDEFHKNPSSIGSRQYTPYAQWKFREFNELPHLFERRLDRSYPTAKEYIDQFPKERTALIMRFVAFVAGSFAAVLLVASLIDPDLFLHFEITPHRTVLFYLGLFGGVLAVARGMIPEENLVFEPEASLREVVKWTHYLPGEWQGKMHSQMVHQEFGTLFSMKIAIFAQELLSVLLTPFILFFSLPPCAGSIIDFFRDFTVHVEGVGYVCSFAVFDFRRYGATTTTINTDIKSDQVSSNPKSVAERDKREWNRASQVDPRENRENRANENKMEKSFLHFKATHPDWIPDPSSSMFLEKMVGGYQKMNPSSSRVNGDKSWGMDENRIQERSRTYDRAWSKGSQYLRTSKRDLSRERRDGLGLENVHEEDEDRGGGGFGNSEEEWYSRKGQDGEDEDEDAAMREERAFLRDVGVTGILQQIIGR